MSETTNAQPLPQPAQPQPSAVWAVPAHMAPPKPERPWKRTAQRWSLLGGLFLGVALVTAVGVMVPNRTDLPGLKTPADARYTFPALKLPALPPKEQGPNETGAATGTAVHFADLRQLLLPAPVGARADTSLPGAGGWYPTASYLAGFSNRAILGGTLSEYGLRHIAATGWTMPDGTRTAIYLLGFRSPSSAQAVYTYDSTDSTLLEAAAVTADRTADAYPGFEGIAQVSFAQDAAGPRQQAVRLAFLDEGDTEALVVLSNPRSVPLVDFEQVAVLQNEMLQG